MFYWMLKFVLIGPLLKLVFRPYVEGRENVPETGGAILASNHLSYLDWLVMPLMVPRKVTFVAKAEYFTTPGLKGWLQRRFFSGAGQVPIDRTSGSAAAGALATGLRVLGNGELFGIYPEGTRSHDGCLYRGRTGVARMALAAKVPVIPIAVVNTNVIAPPGRVFGRYARPYVRFGEPLDFSRYEGMEEDRFVLRSITDEIMYEIMELSGQEYVDAYATRARQQAQQQAKAEEKAAKAEEKAAKRGDASGGAGEQGTTAKSGGSAGAGGSASAGGLADADGSAPADGSASAHEPIDSDGPAGSGESPHSAA